MEFDSKDLHIGVFDSGMGGISVLGELITLMPNESFIYYGDSLNAPYGIKSKENVTELSMEVCDFLIDKGVKAIVVACNTATSAAITSLRKKYDIPIIGMEPAIKPALESSKGKKVVVMATPMTLNQKKFNSLLEKLSSRENIIKIPAPKLVEFVEAGDLNSLDLKKYIINYFDRINLEEVGSVVLGCTHFVFLKDIIKSVVGDEIELVDGNYGTANHLKNTLEKLCLISNKDKSEVLIYNSKCDDKMIELSKKLLNSIVK